MCLYAEELATVFTGDTLFVAGCVANQGAVHDRFDAVVLLDAPVDVLLARVADRANPYGSTAQDRDRIRADAAAVVLLLRAGADAELDARMPPEEVADALERLALRPPRPRRSRSRR